MASSPVKGTSSSPKKNEKSGKTKKKTTKADTYKLEQENTLSHEIGLIIFFVVMVLLFFCNFGWIGPVGNAVSGILFGLFGFTAYIAPILLFFAVAFWFANEENPNAIRKEIAGITLFLVFGIFCDLIFQSSASMETYHLKVLYETCKTTKAGGGILAGSLSYFLQHYLEIVGTIMVMLLCSVVSLIILTEKSFLTSVKNSSNRLKEISKEEARRRKEIAQIRRQEQEEIQQEKERQQEEELRLREKEENKSDAPQKVLRMDKKVSGVTMDTFIKGQQNEYHSNEVQGIACLDLKTQSSKKSQKVTDSSKKEENLFFDLDKVKIHSVNSNISSENADITQKEIQILSGDSRKKEKEKIQSEQEKPNSHKELQQIRIHKEEVSNVDIRNKQSNIVPSKNLREQDQKGKQYAVKTEQFSQNIVGNNILVKEDKEEKSIPKKYMFPSLSMLKKGKPILGDSTRELKETAMRLQQTLHTFGVKVTITDISQGPSVTRYELQPEQGVKVSKIVGLADDIKLNLAAMDIRIEAPIPGKAAIGIEVPNKENMMVALRDLLETKEFQNFPSNIAFAVGKDIAGKVVVADIAKMPHMLIAGATGSGKSVCINTLIISILYKANPDNVKLIMIDPKVVELSVYNGIPHLMIPVVTDPKKASAALHWGVSEMDERYRKFADFSVRDLAGYNEVVENMRKNGDEEAPAKLPQIVIIVDELADLMMVCPGEVEESICRLAQLARAAGIHLIIATQRPSVDVITGLIKANMPSRVAFSVSSGVDSRTILDMNGAEKLLGKGDMLFYPQGYTKPARVQGAFVSDKEVFEVVDFLKNQKIANTYAEDVEEKIKSMGSSGNSSAGGSERDSYFEEAGRFLIEKDKASIGLLQRALKIGFNRAARIMDQLCEYGVVGEEEGTKPRKVLMSMEQFEQLLEEI